MSTDNNICIMFDYKWIKKHFISVWNLHFVKKFGFLPVSGQDIVFCMTTTINIKTFVSSTDKL